MGFFIEDKIEILSSDRKGKSKDSNSTNIQTSKIEISTFFSKDITNFFRNHDRVSSTKKARCCTEDLVQRSDEAFVQWRNKHWISIKLLVNLISIISKTISIFEYFLLFWIIFSPPHPLQNEQIKINNNIPIWSRFDVTSLLQIFVAYYFCTCFLFTNFCYVYMNSIHLS